MIMVKLVDSVREVYCKNNSKQKKKPCWDRVRIYKYWTFISWRAQAPVIAVLSSYELQRFCTVSFQKIKRNFRFDRFLKMHQTNPHLDNCWQEALKGIRQLQSIFEPLQPSIQFTLATHTHTHSWQREVTSVCQVCERLPGQKGGWGGEREPESCMERSNNSRRRKLSFPIFTPHTFSG